MALLHVAAFSMGYFLCKGLGFNEKTSRTVSIETGAPCLSPASMCWQSAGLQPAGSGLLLHTSTQRACSCEGCLSHDCALIAVSKIRSRRIFNFEGCNCIRHAFSRSWLLESAFAAMVFQFCMT